jgi:hypothetical protein
MYIHENRIRKMKLQVSLELKKIHARSLKIQDLKQREGLFLRLEERNPSKVGGWLGV